MKEQRTMGQIAMDAGLSSNPGFYAGRTEDYHDLNSEIIERVYRGVVADYGEKAGESVVKMVSGLPRLTASRFLSNLFRLPRADWDWDERWDFEGRDKKETPTPTTESIRRGFLEKYGKVKGV
jgi:hypothetical protein